MSHEIEVQAPDLGVEKAQVIDILVKVGDTVAYDDDLILVESEKASVEVPSNEAGEIVEILVSEGDEISQGTALVKLKMADVDADADANSEARSETKDQHLDEKADVENGQPSKQQVSQSPDHKQSSQDGSTTSKADADKTNADKTDENKSDTANAQTYNLPDLGVEKAQVSELLVHVGERVVKDDPLMLLESEKASVEVPSPAGGEVVEILLAQGDAVSAGQAFVVIKTADQQDESTANDKTESAKTANDTNTDTNIKADAASKTSSEQPVAQAKSTTNQSAPSQSTPPKTKTSSQAVYAGPAVRKLCRELGVDITQVEGTGVKGRIVKDDVHEFVKQRMQNGQSGVTVQAGVERAASTSQHSGLPPLPDMTGSAWGETHSEALTNLQKASIPQLTLNTLIPQVTQFDLADITETENYRASIKAELKKEGVSLTIVAFIIKAVAYALKQYPTFNSHLSDDHSQLIMRDEVHLGIAVATEAGLIVPVLRHADQKGLKQIATELGELATKARNKRLGKADLTGAGFSISSQGNLGGTYFTPLVNHPQVAILGISEATMQPRWDDDKEKFKPRLMLPLSLSYDHRVINGADAAVFTRYLAGLLGDVRRLLL